MLVLVLDSSDTVVMIDDDAEEQGLFSSLKRVSVRQTLIGICGDFFRS